MCSLWLTDSGGTTTRPRSDFFCALESTDREFFFKQFLNLGIHLSLATSLIELRTKSRGNTFFPERLWPTPDRGPAQTRFFSDPFHRVGPQKPMPDRP